MALTVTARGTGTHNSGATSFGLSPNANCTAGALLVLCVAADNSSSGGATNDFTTVTDGLGNTWTKRQSPVFDNGAASAGVQGAIYTTRQNVGPVQTSTTITVNFGSSPVAKTWTLTEITAAANKFANVRTGGDKSAGATGTALSTGASSTVNVGECIVAAFFLEAGTTQGITAEDTDGTNGSWTTSAYAEIGTTTSGSVIASSTKIQTTANSTQSYDVTVSVSSDYHASYIIVNELNAYTLAMGSGSFAETGTAATLKHGYLVSAGSGAFAETGTAATLKAARKIAASGGTFTETGTAATLRRGYPLSAGSGAFTETGTATTLKAARVIAAGSGTFAETGTAATLKRGLVVAASGGSFSETGSSATLTYTPVTGYTLAAGGATFAESGTAATLKVGRLVAAGTGSFTETGTAAGLIAMRRLAASGGSITETGTSATLKCGRRVTASGGTYAESGTASSLKTGHILACGSATCSVTGAAATLTYTPRVYNAFTLTASAAACAASGTAATLARSRRFDVDAGACSCTGASVTMTKFHPPPNPRKHDRSFSVFSRGRSFRTFARVGRSRR